MLQNISISDKCCSSELSIHQRNLKKIYSAVFIIHNNNNNNNKCILIIRNNLKSEYLNDFWTSCDWSNDAENSALITGINYILKYILNIKNISQYYCFCCILDQTNTGLVNRRDFFKKNNKKILLFKNFWMVVYIYIYILYGGGGPPGPKNARADCLSQSSPDYNTYQFIVTLCILNSVKLFTTRCTLQSTLWIITMQYSL